jgi:hypothetical protein
LQHGVPDRVRLDLLGLTVRVRAGMTRGCASKVAARARSADDPLRSLAEQ